MEQTSCPGVSVILITGNVIERSPGQAVFEQVLRSVSWADELIVVDSASTDRTREVAARYTSKIFVHPFCGSLIRQKEIALRYASHPWILWVDADEVLPPDLIEEIQQALHAPTADGYRLFRRHIFVGRPLLHDQEEAKVRLWRRGTGHWAGEENDDFYVVPGPNGCLKTPLDHYSTGSLADRIRKIAYFAPAHVALAPLPPRADFTLRDTWTVLLRPPLQRFYGLYWARRGYRDGVRGLIWAALCAIGSFFNQILLWERAQTEATPDASTVKPASSVSHATP